MGANPKWLSRSELSRLSIPAMLVTWAILQPACEESVEAPWLLESGVTIEATVDAKKLQQVYRVALSRPEVLYLQVEQHDLDVIVDLLAPDGGILLSVDSPNGRHGSEELWWQAETTGSHRIMIRTPARISVGGHFQVYASLLSPAGLSEGDRHRLAATRKRQEAARLSGRDTVQALRQTVSHWRAAGEHQLAVLALIDLASRLGRQGDAEEEPTLQRALELAQQSGVDPAQKLQMRILRQLGQTYWGAGDRDRAWQSHERALELARVNGDKPSEALCLNQMALLETDRQAPRRALELYRLSLELFREIRQYRRAAMVLHNMGQAFSHLGKLDQALDALNEACALGQRFGSRRSLASSYFQLAWVYHLSGRDEEALELFREVRSTYEDLGDRRGRAAVLDRLGTVLQSLGRLDEAGEVFAEVLAAARRRGDPYGEAHSSMNVAEVHLAGGRIDAAQRAVRQSLASLDALPRDDPHGRAHALLLESRVLREIGELEAALERSSAALDIIESLRLKAASQSLTLPFFATRREYFEHHIDLLLALDEQFPGRGYAARALEIFELGRARSLIESIGRQGTLKGSGAAPPAEELGPDIDEVSRRISAGSAAEIRHLLDALGDLQSAPAVTQPPVLAADEIGTLLDESTLLLAYHLSAESSHVWSIDGRGVEVHDLLPAAAIENEARRLLRSVPRSDHEEHRQPFRLALGRLSAWLLGPVAARLESARRLVIVGEGAIHVVPVAALPSPASREPMGERYEIVRLPSASLLAALRRRAAGRAPAGGVAIFADPVFAARPGGGQVARDVEPILSAGAAALPQPFDPSALPRLVASRHEAAAIAELWPDGESWVALGTEASEHNLLAADLESFRVLHFATHAIQHPVHPELAAIVLSRPPGGRPADGLLRAYEIANLRLSADLVVLSACRTARGKEVAGEGVLSLARAFLHAGARSVLVSLWPVDDQATAAFMAAFYRALIADGLSKSAALKRAQRKIREHPDWNRPYYWAGFELQGDWR